MFSSLHKLQDNSVSKIFISAMAVVIAVTMSFVPGAYAADNTVLGLPEPGTMVSKTQSYQPTIINGIVLNPENPLQFDFLVNRGDQVINGPALEAESEKLIKYFMAALTMPEKEMWVNLSPYENDRIIPEEFSKTEMGRDLLAQDYMLKQITASLMYPEDDLGHEFWKRVYEKAETLYGTTDIPMNSFNKVWIIPEKAVIYQHERAAFVIESRLKVLLEGDYLALGNNVAKFQNAESRNEEMAGVSSEEMVRDLIIPELEREVNEGKVFANLRQIYNSMILATWYKKNLKESLLGRVYVDQAKTVGVSHNDPEINQKIYDQYMEAFKKGAYNFVKEDYDPTTQKVIPRKYFSGGFDSAALADQISNTQAIDPQTVMRQFEGDILVSAGFKGSGRSPISFDKTAFRSPSELGFGDVAMMADGATEIKRVGVLTNGGPASGHNENIATLSEELALLGIELVPIFEGYNGLLKQDLIERSKEGYITTDQNGDIFVTDVLSGNRVDGGSVIIASRANPYSAAGKEADQPAKLWEGIQEIGLDALITMGGDDTGSVAYEIQQEHPEFPVIHLPKTMDNDINLPDIKQTYGFDSFVQAATAAAEAGVVSAKSEKKILVMESFGRAAGWAPLYVGANIRAARTIIPEEGPIDLEKLLRDLQAYYDANQYAVVVVSEGVSIDENLGNNKAILAKAFEEDSVAEAAFRNPSLKTDPHGNPKLKNAGLILTAVLDANMPMKVRQAGNLDYNFRDAQVSRIDCLMCNSISKEAVRALTTGRHGLVIYQNTADEIVSIEIPPPDQIGGRFVGIEVEGDRVEGEQASVFLQANQALADTRPDAAVTAQAQTENPGGIDLDPEFLDMSFKGDAGVVQMNVPVIPLNRIDVDGFSPVIINVTPVFNLPMLLGVTVQENPSILGYVPLSEVDELSLLR